MECFLHGFLVLPATAFVSLKSIRRGKTFIVFHCFTAYLFDSLRAVVFWTLHAGAFCLQSGPLLDANFAGIRGIYPFYPNLLTISRFCTYAP